MWQFVEFCLSTSARASEIIYLLGSGCARQQRRGGLPRHLGSKNSPHRGPPQGVRPVLGGLGAGWCLGEIRRLSRGILGHAGGWPSQWSGVFVGVHRHHSVSRLGDLDVIKRLRRRRCGGRRVWRVRATWRRAPLFGSLRVTGWIGTWAQARRTRKRHVRPVGGLAE